VDLTDVAAIAAWRRANLASCSTRWPRPRGKRR